MLLRRLLTLLSYVPPRLPLLSLRFLLIGHRFVVSDLNAVDTMIRLLWEPQNFSPGTTDKTSQTSQAFDQLERDASLKTQGAVDEGKRDVHEAAVVGGSYLGAAIDTVKVVFYPTSLLHRANEYYF